MKKITEDTLDEDGKVTLYQVREFDKNYRLKKFCINLTLKITGGETQQEVIRYDCAHGHLHMHRFYRKPPTNEKIIMEVSRETAKRLVMEVRENWQVWVRAFTENYTEGQK